MNFLVKFAIGSLIGLGVGIIKVIASNLESEKVTPEMKGENHANI